MSAYDLVGQYFREDFNSTHCRQWRSGINRDSGERAREVDSRLEENMTAVRESPISHALRMSI